MVAPWQHSIKNPKIKGSTCHWYRESENDKQIQYQAAAKKSYLQTQYNMFLGSFHLMHFGTFKIKCMDNNQMYFWLLPVCCNKMLGHASQDPQKLMEQDALKINYQKKNITFICRYSGPTFCSLFKCCHFMTLMGLHSQHFIFFITYEWAQ